MTTRSVTPGRLLLAAAAALVAVALVLQLGHRSQASVVADPLRTPGVVNPNVTQENISSTICKRGWTATIRPPVDYTNALKRRQMRAYGETGPLSAYQEDHLGRETRRPAYEAALRAADGSGGNAVATLAQPLSPSAARIRASFAAESPCSLV